MKNQNKRIENLYIIEGTYRLNVGDICVDMIYSENKKSFNECMVNILKQKIKKC